MTSSAQSRAPGPLAAFGRSLYYGSDAGFVAVLARRPATGGLRQLPPPWACIGDELVAGCRLVRRHGWRRAAGGLRSQARRQAAPAARAGRLSSRTTRSAPTDLRPLRLSTQPAGLRRQRACAESGREAPLRCLRGCDGELRRHSRTHSSGALSKRRGPLSPRRAAATAQHLRRPLTSSRKRPVDKRGPLPDLAAVGRSRPGARGRVDGNGEQSKPASGSARTGRSSGSTASTSSSMEASVCCTGGREGQPEPGASRERTPPTATSGGQEQAITRARRTFVAVG
jgi:hypothetical protein